MNFIRRIGRDEIYIKYVHQLVNVRGIFCNSVLYTDTVSRCTSNHKTTLRQPSL